MLLGTVGDLEFDFKENDDFAHSVVFAAIPTENLVQHCKNGYKRFTAKMFGSCLLCLGQVMGPKNHKRAFRMSLDKNTKLPALLPRIIGKLDRPNQKSGGYTTHLLFLSCLVIYITQVVKLIESLFTNKIEHLPYKLSTRAQNRFVSSIRYMIECTDVDSE